MFDDNEFGIFSNDGGDYGSAGPVNSGSHSSDSGGNFFAGLGDLLGSAQGLVGGITGILNGGVNSVTNNLAGAVGRVTAGANVKTTIGLDPKIMIYGAIVVVLIIFGRKLF